MVALTEALDIKAVANEVVASLASHRQILTFSSRPVGLTLAQAYRVTPLLRAAFEARGEKITGRKIGFTNREMWKVYGVQSPIWGDATNRTTYELASTKVLPVKDFTEPRIEPEIMFGLKAAPLPGMNEAALLDCRMGVSRLRDCAVDVSWLEIHGGGYSRCKWCPRRAGYRTTPRNCAAQDRMATRTSPLRCRTFLQRQAEPARERRSCARQPSSSTAASDQTAGEGFV
jgi:hypothetical protein